MKTIAVKVAGSEGAPMDVQLEPGTTAADILKGLQLKGYLLSMGPQADSFFADSENVYAAVQDGDKVWATTRAEVGC